MHARDRMHFLCRNMDAVFKFRTYNSEYKVFLHTYNTTEMLNNLYAALLSNSFQDTFPNFTDLLFQNRNSEN